ncbi:phage major capsid protein [Bifidobacterium subtile]|uniref:phage major capsid protein n=1 Tax=Bifidobacterium subtile TaxID=77635 RepID=UPI002F35E5D4
MALLTSTGGKAAYPDTSWMKAKDALPTALILDERIATAGPEIVGDAPTLRIPIITADPEAEFYAEGEQIAESDAGFSEVVVSTRKIGMLNSLSNEAFSVPTGPSMLSDAIVAGMIGRADQALLLDPGTNGSPTGLSRISGATTTTAADIDTKGLQPILESIAAVTDLGANPTSLIMRHSAWARLQGLTATDGRPLIQPDVQNVTAPALFGVPVILSKFTPADTIIVNDASNIIASTSELAVARSDDALFAKDAVMLRATMRVGFGIVAPAKLGIIGLKPKA